MYFHRFIFTFILVTSPFFHSNARPIPAPQGQSGDRGQDRQSSRSQPQPQQQPQAPQQIQQPARQQQQMRQQPARIQQQPARIQQQPLRPSRSDFSVPQQPSVQQRPQRPHNQPTVKQRSSREQLRQNLERSRPREIKRESRDRPQDNREDAHRVRDHIGRYRDYHRWFNRDFYGRHHYYPNYYVNNWWGYPSWSGLSGWLGWSNYNPIYYDDSYTPYELQQGSEDYPDLTPFPEVNLYQERQTITTPPSQSDWLSLGVFVAARDVSQASASNMFVQLSVNKSGDIAGTYYNASTDQVRPLEGIIDKAVQLAMWKLGDQQDSPVMMTGVYNLTQSVSPIRVQFPDRREENWVLVRLDQNQ